MKTGDGRFQYVSGQEGHRWHLRRARQCQYTALRVRKLGFDPSSRPDGQSRGSDNALFTGLL